MPAGQARLLPPATLDEMYRSLNDAFRAVGLAPPRFTPPPDITVRAAAPHRAPNSAKAPQTIPPRSNLQNEPNAAGACPKKSPNVPFPAMHSAPPTRQRAPFHAIAPHASACKTNPPPPAPSSIFGSTELAEVHSPSSPSRLRPLTPHQLRAARLLVAGQSTNAIAATLHIDRHTLADWKRLELFQKEIRHLLDHPAPLPQHPTPDPVTTRP
ncbi:MAG: hypothetical protein JWN40_2680 [Phycisphaerales bacterium]|nr:hypothetical protein [Phycisphaerales bacterium]